MTKRIREGHPWRDCAIGMTSRYEGGDLVLVPFDQETGQWLFRFMVE